MPASIPTTFFSGLRITDAVWVALLAARGFPAVPLLGVLLPVGISFYTFQAIGYTVDVYRGSVSAEQRFLAVSAVYLLLSAAGGRAH